MSGYNCLIHTTASKQFNHRGHCQLRIAQITMRAVGDIAVDRRQWLGRLSEPLPLFLPNFFDVFDLELGCIRFG
jgi:hypothetical protein